MPTPRELLLSLCANINALILQELPGLKGSCDTAKLDGALGRVENAISYSGLDDVFLIAAKYVASIAASHFALDANKRSAYIIAIHYLSLNGFEIKGDNELIANAVRDLVVNEITEKDFADILYSQYIHCNSSLLGS